MYLNIQAAVQESEQACLSTASSPQQPSSSPALRLAERRKLNYARTFPFPDEVRVAGFLLAADVGPMSYGLLYGRSLGNEQSFVQFDAIGIDHCAGYDIVRTSAGVAYVIAGYAPHALERGMSHLKEHIAVNADWYAARALTLASPWLHSQAMIEHLAASWRQRLSPLKAESRVAALLQALEFLQSK